MTYRGKSDSRTYSDSTLDALAEGRRLGEKYGAVACPTCTLPMLPEHPHNHHSEPLPGYDPMPTKPATRDDLTAYIRRELFAEAEDRLHTWAVPSEVERIDLDGWLDGPTMAVTDTGELGAPSFSPAFHRRIGGYHWDEEREMMAEGQKPKPWTRNLDGLRRWCSGKHRQWYEHGGQPLCWELVRMVMLGGYAVSRAGEQYGLSPEKAGELYDDALDKWWTWTGNEVNGLTTRRVKRKAA